MAEKREIPAIICDRKGNVRIAGRTVQASDYPDVASRIRADLSLHPHWTLRSIVKHALTVISARNRERIRKP